MRYEARRHGEFGGDGEVLYDMTDAPGGGTRSTTQVDVRQPLRRARAGVWILSPQGERLGTAGLPRSQQPGWGGETTGTLYVTALTNRLPDAPGYSGIRRREADDTRKEKPMSKNLEPGRRFPTSSCRRRTRAAQPLGDPGGRLLCLAPEPRRGTARASACTTARCCASTEWWLLAFTDSSA